MAALAIGGMLLRPKGTSEALWIVAGAAVLTVLGTLSLRDAAASVLRGADVYAFLAGIMLLAEVARYEGLFDWVASQLLVRCGGSRARLFFWTFAAGVVVTAFLSNDTTAVVMTPAVLAAMRRSDASPVPYLYACAFVSNAASFVLPISNPANLVMLGARLLPLGAWFLAFGAASAVALAVTFACARWDFREELRGTYRLEARAAALTRRARFTAAALACAAVALVWAACRGANVGYTAAAAAALVTAAVATQDRAAAAFAFKHVTWSVLPLVAGLFVIVAALDRNGAVDALRLLLSNAHAIAPLAANVASGAAATLASVILNNLPVALAAGTAFSTMPPAGALAHGALVGVDLGPNLSVSGSLATLLWAAILRRDGIDVTPWSFVRHGFLAAIPALLLAELCVR